MTDANVIFTPREILTRRLTVDQLPVDLQVLERAAMLTISMLLYATASRHRLVLWGLLRLEVISVLVSTKKSYSLQPTLRRHSIVSGAPCWFFRYRNVHGRIAILGLRHAWEACAIQGRMNKLELYICAQPSQLMTGIPYLHVGLGRVDLVYHVPSLRMLK